MQPKLTLYPAMRLAPAAVLLCLMLVFPAQAKTHHATHHTPPAPSVSVTGSIGHAEGVQLSLRVHNPLSTPICALPAYNTPARVTATRRGHTLRNLQIHEPVPARQAQAQCLRLDPTANTGVVYRLDRMYSEPLTGARICYSFPWRRIDQLDTHQASVCVTGS